MSSTSIGRDLAVQTTGTGIEGQQLKVAGHAANRAAANYLFADYRQRQAGSTLRTLRAGLLGRPKPDEDEVPEVEMVT